MDKNGDFSTKHFYYIEIWFIIQLIAKHLYMVGRGFFQVYMPYTLPETGNFLVFQPSIFRCKLTVSFREGKL